MIFDQVMVDSNNQENASFSTSRSTSSTPTLSHNEFNKDYNGITDWGTDSNKQESVLSSDSQSFKIRHDKKHEPLSVITSSSRSTSLDYSSFPTPLTESIISYNNDCDEDINNDNNNNFKWDFNPKLIYNYDDSSTDKSTVIYTPDIISHSPSPFSEDTMNFIYKYTKTTSSVNKMVKSSTDKFKFEIITSTFLDDTSNISIRNKSKTYDDFRQSSRKMIIDISALPHNILIHSSIALLLSIALLKFAQKKNKQLKSAYIRIIIKIAVTLLSVYNDTRKMASMIYLRMVNNKISLFLKINEKFDHLLNKHLKLIKSSSNSHLNFILGGSLKKQSIKTSKLLTQSSLQTLMLSLNERIQRLIYFVDANYFQRYLDIYHLDFINEDLMFVNLLNHGELLDDLKIPRLKPLRLRSFSGDTSFPQSQQHQKYQHPQQQSQQSQQKQQKQQQQQQQSLLQLPNNPFKLLHHFQAIRRVFFCVLLSVLECDSEQPSKESRLYLNICLRKFNLSIPSTNAPILHVGTLTRLFLIIKILSRLSILFNGMIYELDDEELLKDVDYLEEELISPIHEDNEDETFSKLIDCVETLRNKLSYMELNSNSIDSKACLNNLDDDMNKLNFLYNQSSGKQLVNSNSLPNSSISPSLDITKPNHKSNDVRNRDTRHSSGLRFSLLSVFEGEDEDVDMREKKEKNVTTVVSSNDGIQKINNNEFTEGVRSKEEMKKTLMKLCSGSGRQRSSISLKNEEDEEENENTQVNNEIRLDQLSSTPDNSSYVDERDFEAFKLELKQKLMVH